MRLPVRRCLLAEEGSKPPKAGISTSLTWVYRIISRIWMPAYSISSSPSGQVLEVGSGSRGQGCQSRSSGCRLIACDSCLGATTTFTLVADLGVDSWVRSTIEGRSRGPGPLDSAPRRHRLLILPTNVRRCRCWRRGTSGVQDIDLSLTRPRRRWVALTLWRSGTQQQPRRRERNRRSQTSPTQLPAW